LAIVCLSLAGARMGKKGTCAGLISRSEKNKMARKVKNAILKAKDRLGLKSTRTSLPEGCKQGTFRRPYWLPRGWLHGVKEGTSGYTGRGLQVYISPEGRRFYHKKDVEKFVGKVLTAEDGSPPTLEEILVNVMGKVPRIHVSASAEGKLFGLLEDQEQRLLPTAKDIHFCVISARRMSTPEGMKDCLIVQEHFEQAGVKPLWYVDKKSIHGYRALGFNVVQDGGSLVAARNKALKDAAKLGKACCQVSDDIRAWHYYLVPDDVKITTEDEANAKARHLRRVAVSPVSAARFILAKMRATKSKLGGVLPTGNVARGLLAPPIGKRSFILGDFFVSELRSAVRFDPHFTLKEDYDFSCSHIQKYGGVLRLNRMVLTVKHYSNAGGAVSVRNVVEEQRNIQILRKKWPRAIRLHPTRENEVVLQWPTKSQ